MSCWYECDVIISGEPAAIICQFLSRLPVRLLGERQAQQTRCLTGQSPVDVTVSQVHIQEGARINTHERLNRGKLWVWGINKLGSLAKQPVNHLKL